MVLERRGVLEPAGERDRQPALRLDVAEQDVGQRVAHLLAREPGHEHRRDRLDPRHRHGRAGVDHDHGAGAHLDDASDQLVLATGESELGTIPTLALPVVVGADDHDRHVGSRGGVDGVDHRDHRSGGAWAPTFTPPSPMPVRRWRTSTASAYDRPASSSTVPVTSALPSAEERAAGRGVGVVEHDVAVDQHSGRRHRLDAEGPVARDVRGERRAEPGAELRVGVVAADGVRHPLDPHRAGGAWSASGSASSSSSSSGSTK